MNKENYIEIIENQLQAKLSQIEEFYQMFIEDEYEEKAVPATSIDVLDSFMAYMGWEVMRDRPEWYNRLGYHLKKFRQK